MDRVRECIERGECRPRHQATKDHKNWCGGKEGRLRHVYALLTPEQCAAIPALARLPGSYWFGFHGRRTLGDGLGYVQYVRACIQCGRVDVGEYAKAYCHCGAPLVKKSSLPHWRRFGASWCERCGYEPHARHERQGNRWVEVRTPCRCEREAHAEAALATSMGRR